MDARAFYIQPELRQASFRACRLLGTPVILKHQRRVSHDTHGPFSDSSSVHLLSESGNALFMGPPPGDLRQKPPQVYAAGLRFALIVTVRKQIMRRRSLSQTLAAYALLACSAVSAQDYLVPRLANGQPDFSAYGQTTLSRLSSDRLRCQTEHFSARMKLPRWSRASRSGASVTTIILWLKRRQRWRLQSGLPDSGDTVLSTGQTSMIIDPRTGVRPFSSLRWRRDFYFANVENDYIYHTVWIAASREACRAPCCRQAITMLIVSADRDSFTIVYEMIHDVRTISLTKRHTSMTR